MRALAPHVNHLSSHEVMFQNVGDYLLRTTKIMGSNRPVAFIVSGQYVMETSPTQKPGAGGGWEHWNSSSFTSALVTVTRKSVTILRIMTAPIRGQPKRAGRLEFEGAVGGGCREIPSPVATNNQQMIIDHLVNSITCLSTFAQKNHASKKTSVQRE